LPAPSARLFPAFIRRPGAALSGLTFILMEKRTLLSATAYSIIFLHFILSSVFAVR
jgi:hypothetical protein